MTEQLHERLADLAGDAASPAPVDPAGLWRTGKRRQRRRTAAAAVAACAVVLAGVSGAGLVAPTADLVGEPSATNTAPALPDRLYAPARWLESNDDDPVGPFAVLAEDQNGGSSEVKAYVGVSAMTGEYRRVELSGVGEAEFGPMGGAAVLSPSGRYIAYWAPDGPLAGGPDGSSAGSPKVYDTVTGRSLNRGWELENMPDAPHGMSLWDLRWIDDTRFYVQAGAIEGGPGTDDASGSRITGAGWVFDLAKKEGPTEQLEVPGAAKTGDVFASDGSGHLLVRAKGKGNGYLLVDPARPAEARAVKVVSGEGGTGGVVRASRDGRVAMATQSSEGNPVLGVTQVDGSHRLFETVPAWDVYGWSDETHVVVGITTPLDDNTSKAAIVEVDVTTGTSTRRLEARPIVALPDSGLNPPQLATGLLGVPTVHRGEPDWPTDPRVFGVLGAGALVLLLTALRIWRRREQR